MKNLEDYNLKTGDLIFCCYQGTGSCYSLCYNIVSGIIRTFIKSNYSHVAMVLKDPVFLHPALRGLYLWECSSEKQADPQDNIHKLGVQITPLAELVNSYTGNGHVAIRRIKCKDRNLLFSSINLEKIHNIVYRKPYDSNIIHLLEDVVKIDFDPQRTDKFVCSSFVAFIYTKCGLLDPKTNWDIITPFDFSFTSDRLKFINGAQLSDYEEKLV